MLTSSAFGHLRGRAVPAPHGCRRRHALSSMAAAVMLVMIVSAAASAGTYVDAPSDPTYVNNAGGRNVLDAGETAVSTGGTHGHSSSAIIATDGEGFSAGDIWVTNSSGSSYSLGMKTFGSGSVTNAGNIYVKAEPGSTGWSAPAQRVSGMAVDGGTAINEGLISVVSGSGMRDNSGTVAKAMINTGTIAVEGAEGVGILFRREGADTTVRNDGTILVSGGGVGVALINDPSSSDAPGALDGKVFTNTGSILAGEDGTAILVAGTADAVIALEGNSRVEGLISLQDTSNRLAVSGVGANGTETLHVKGAFSGSVTGSDIAFTADSDIVLDGAFSVDRASRLAMTGVTLAGSGTAADRGLLVIDDGTATFNGGTAAGGFLGGVSVQHGSVVLTDALFSGNELSGASVVSNGGTLIFSGSNRFENNGSDVDNRGVMIVADGTTLLNSGYAQTGADSALVVRSGAALGIASPDLGGVTVGEGKAVLALGQKLDLSRGGTISVGGTERSGGAQASFGADSVLVLDGRIAGDGAAITGSGALSVAEGSTLYIANAQDGGNYVITDGLSTGDGYWTTANLLAGRLMEVGIDVRDGRVVVSTEGRNAAVVLPGVIPVSALNAMTAGRLYDVDASAMGVRFLSRAMDNGGAYLADDAMAVDTVNEVSRAAVTAGVQNTALRLAGAGAEQIGRHLSLSFSGDVRGHGAGLWAAPVYGNLRTHGMTSPGTSVRGNVGGVVLGLDAVEGGFLGGTVRAGAAVSGGAGRSESRGTAVSADNVYNFGGVHLYAGWTLDDLNVAADAGYVMTDHDLTMRLPAGLGMGRAGAGVDTGVLTAGLRAEYRIRTSAADIIPHAGVRFSALHTGSHGLNIDGSPLNRVRSDTQHIVQFPAGVTVSGDIDVAGWNVKPLVDLSVIPSAGDTKNTTAVSYAGIGAEDVVKSRIMDATSWAGTVGVQAEKDGFSFGLHYGLQASAHETDQSVGMGFSWKF